MTNLKTKTARAKLKPNGNGYAQNLASGRALLYRKRSATNAGRWLLRTAKDTGGYSFETLAVADDYADADGVKVLTYAQALETALGRTSADPTRITVADALDAWAEGKCRSASSDKARLDYRSAARRLSAAFPKATLKSITARQIENWKADGLAKGKDPRARAATVNRELATFKAALTQAADLNGYEGNRAWVRVKKFTKAESFAARMVIVTEDEEAALIAAADDDLAVLLTGLQKTGARFGELRQCSVGDLHGDRLTIRAGKTGLRTIALAFELATWFAEVAGNRPATDPLFARANGTGWPDGGQLKPTARAVKAAGFDADVTTYTLRHGFISRALSRGVPTVAVAKYCGTSVEMIESSYAKFLPAQMQEWFG